jgi:hypothetical protein
MVKNQVEYDATLWAQRNAEREKRFEEGLKCQAQRRGYKLVRIEELPAAQSFESKWAAGYFLKSGSRQISTRTG